MKRSPIDNTRKDVSSTFASTMNRRAVVRSSKAPNREASVNKLKRLLNSKRLELISLGYSGDRKAFRVKTSAQQKSGVVYSGLTTRLKEVFYPNGGDAAERKEQKRRERDAPKSLVKGAKAGCGIYGKDHGILVHKQIEDYINILVLDGDIGNFFNIHEVPDPCFLRFIKTCDLKGWFPVVSELFIFDEAMKVATAIDVVCLDCSDFSIVVIDVKNGYENVSYAAVPSDPMFSAPLDNIQDCPLNRHALQLMVTKIILGVDYRIVPEKFRLVRMCPKQGSTKVYEMPSWFYDKKIAEAVYGRLVTQKE